MNSIASNVNIIILCVFNIIANDNNVQLVLGVLLPCSFLMLHAHQYHYQVLVERVVLKKL